MTTEPKEITAADVVAWLKAECSKAAIFTKKPEIELSVGTVGVPFMVSVGATFTVGDTPAEAVAEYCRRFGIGSNRAKMLREQAAKLLAEADALSPKAA